MRNIFAFFLAIIGLFMSRIIKNVMILNSAYSYKTILVKSNGVGIIKDRINAAIVTPGDLLDLDSDGYYVPHAGANLVASAIFALEEDLVGESIDTNYASGDTTRGYYAQPGDEIFAWLKNGESVTPADYLVSGGAGNLAKYAVQAVDEGGSATFNISDHMVVAKPLETLNNTTGSDARILVEVV